MKQSILFALITWSSFNSTAQITVTSSTFPASGDKLRYVQVSNPNAAISLLTPPGGNQDWNLSTLGVGSVFETSFRPAIEGANAANFAGANLVVKEGATESYYKSSATKLELLGQVSTTIGGINLKAIYINQPAIAVRQSPLNFFDLYQQSSNNLLAWAFNEIPTGAINLSFTPDSIRIRVSKQITEVVDGWGTLTLPGSLPQSQYPVLRLKKTTYQEQRIDAKVPPSGWLDVTDNVLRGGTAWSNLLFGVDTTVTYHYFNNIEKEEIAVLTFNQESGQTVAKPVVYKNTTANIIPVEFLSFNANKIDNQTIRLSWTTLTELNSDYFSVERSTDGKLFLAIGQVNAAGQSSKELNYIFDDLGFTTENALYYRLQPVDNNGQFKYSKTVSVSNNNKNSKWTIHPNPVKDIITVAGFDNLKSVKIYNIQGVLVQRSNFSVVSLSDISAGIYILEAENTEGAISRMKFVKE